MSYEIRFDGHDISLVCNGANYEEVVLQRCNNRWQATGHRGPYIKKVLAGKYLRGASAKFYTRDELEDYADSLGRFIDEANIAIRTGFEERAIRQRQEAINQGRELFKKKQREAAKHTQYVYLMTHRNGLTKIGRSKKPAKREKTLQAEDPRLQMLFFFPGDNTIETRLHRVFSHNRRRGEWFDLQARHIDWIKAIFIDLQKMAHLEKSQPR